jgi:hypothetical protein
MRQSLFARMANKNENSFAATTGGKKNNET